jgi:tRNA (guanine-N7-)-methyltransferase
MRFLESYQKILRSGGEIHFKTDNLPLFEYSLTEFYNAGFALSEVTRDLHGGESGPAGVMTDYEIKFYEQGTPIKRCVAIWNT